MECENAVEVLCSQVRWIVFLLERKTRMRLAYLFAATLGEEKQEDGRICSERLPEKKITQGDSVVVRANLGDKSRGKMTEPDGALRLVAVLATRSRCSESIHLALCKKITLAQLEKIHHHRSFFALLLTPATCCMIIISSSIRPGLQAPPVGAAASSLYAKCSNERKL
jgi:hypothetical protein